MIPLLHPSNYFWEECVEEVAAVLRTRWWGQGSKVEELESLFGEKFSYEYCLSVNSGTSALELAYHLVGINDRDEVISPVRTCSATNIPVLRRGSKIVFADIDKKTLTIDATDVESKINPRTKAIVAVTLGGMPIDSSLYSVSKKYNVPLIIDACQSLGSTEKFGDYVCYSFQAIKHFSSGDGGMLVLRNETDYQRAKRLRWFGIDRKQRVHADWQPYDNRLITMEVEEPGYKFHMNDIAASLAIVGLRHSDEIMERRKRIAALYDAGLRYCGKISGGSYWLYCVLIDSRDIVAMGLWNDGIETSLVHIRNDILQVFGGKRRPLINMDYIENKYLYLPINTVVSDNDVERIIASFNKSEAL